MQGKPRYRIGTVAMILLPALAVVCDLFGLIPFVKDALGTIFWVVANIYLFKKGVSMFSGKKLATMLVSWVAGLIPVIQELPIELSLGIVAIIIMTRIEDKTGVKLPLPGTTSARTPLNTGNARMPASQTTNSHIAPAPKNIDGMRMPEN